MGESKVESGGMDRGTPECRCALGGYQCLVVCCSPTPMCGPCRCCCCLLFLLQEHWEKFVALFDKTLTQLDREIPEETRAAAIRSIHATKHYFVPIGQETEYTNSSIAAMPVEEAPVAAAAAAGGEIQQQL